MSRRQAALVVAILGLGIPSAHAGPCSEAIAQFEQAGRQSASNAAAGPTRREPTSHRTPTTPHAEPTAPQRSGAQLSHEPTPASIKRAKARARAAFAAALARAKRLDAQGDRARCTKALARAKDMYVLN